MIVQIMAYDPNFYKENTLVFDEIFFTYGNDVHVIRKDEIWSQFISFHNWKADHEAYVEQEWLYLKHFNIDSSVEDSLLAEGIETWTKFYPCGPFPDMPGGSTDIQLGLDVFSAWHLPSVYDTTTIDSSRTYVAGRFADVHIAEPEIPVLPQPVHTASNSSPATFRASYPVLDNSVVEVYTSSIDIIPAPDAVYPPSTY